MACNVRRLVDVRHSDGSPLFLFAMGGLPGNLWCRLEDPPCPLATTGGAPPWTTKGAAPVLELWQVAFTICDVCAGDREQRSDVCAGGREQRTAMDRRPGVCEIPRVYPHGLTATCVPVAANNVPTFVPVAVNNAQ